MEWISVKDRLPSGYTSIDKDTGYAEPEEYIVRVKHASFATVASFDGEKFIPLVPVGCTDVVEFAEEVTHWMPLPEPPKENI